MPIPFAVLRAVGYALSVVAVTAAGTSACAGRHAANAEPQIEADPLEPTPLTVTNHHWLDVVVFVFHDGELSRVGTVTAASQADFSLPNWMIGQTRNIYLFADPVGSGTSVRTETIHIQPGQFIEWQLENQLARSTVAVY